MICEIFGLLIFQSLCRNFGDSFLHLFEPHIKRLAAEPTENAQRCAAEALSGKMQFYIANNFSEFL